MDATKKILSDITVHMKYARFRDDLGRRENWSELVTRNMEMHIKKFQILRQKLKMHINLSMTRRFYLR